jgi:hypothetical protein
MAKMTDEELRAIVAAGVRDTIGYHSGEISEQRRKALDYYYGKPFGNEVEGRSEVVSTEVADTIEWILPSLLRIFTSGDQTVKFEPVGPEDVAAAEQETDVVNHVWNQQNEGFLNFHTWFKDALLQKNGVVKIWWEDSESSETETYRGLDEFEYAKLKSDPDVETVEHETREEPGIDPMTGQPALLTVHDCTLKRKKNKGQVTVECVPPEEFLIGRRAKSINDSAIVVHRVKKTASQLIAEGYDRKLVESLDGDDEGEFNEERTARFSPDESSDARLNPAVDKSMREIWVHEAYLKVDYDGDGIAELRKVCVAGGKHELLDNEPVDDDPFADICPVPMPHKFHGLSIADLTMDLQLIKSTILRQLLDNLYLVNNHRNVVVDGEVNLDDLLVSRPGGIVRAKRTDAIMPLITQPLNQSAFGMLEYIDTIKENRTGVTRYNQGLDANSLNKTMGGITQIMNAAQARIELIARIFAETGVKRAFSKVHRLLKSHYSDSKPLTMRIRGKWVEVDPRQWKTRTDLTVAVGLGTGNKDQMLQHLMNVAMLQEKAVMLQGGGVQGPLVTMENLYNTAEKVVENSGLKQAELYFTKPDPNAPPPPKPPSPEEQKLELEKQKFQIEAQAKMQDMQLSREEMQNKIELMWAEFQADRALQAQKVQSDQILAEQKMQNDTQLQNQKLQADTQMQQQKLGADIRMQRTKLSADTAMAHQKQMGDFKVKQQALASPPNTEQPAEPEDIPDVFNALDEVAKIGPALDQMAQALAMMAQQLQANTQAVQAERVEDIEVIRDPKTNRIVRGRKRVTLQ